MSKPRIEFRINCKPISIEEVKKLGVLNSVSLREIADGVWSYSDSCRTKYADYTWGGGRENGVSYEVLGRLLNDDKKLVSVDDETASISGMFDIVIFGLDMPVIAVVSNRYGMEAIIVENSAYKNVDVEKENSVDIDLYVEEG